MPDYKHILSCWHKLEHFSPALLPKDNSVKRLGEELSWMRPLEAKDPRKDDSIHYLSGCLFSDICFRFCKRIL